VSAGAFSAIIGLRPDMVDAAREDTMAKGQMKKPKEAKKPKSDKPKGEGSAYKQAMGKGGKK
jgi:hypothetical protein